MKTFLTVLLVIAGWLIPVYILFASSHRSFALIYGLLYGVSWIVFVIVMAAREREREERRFKEECRRERIAYERERRRRQACNRNNIVRVRIM